MLMPQSIHRTSGIKRGYPFDKKNKVLYKWRICDVLRSMKYHRHHPHECVRESSVFSNDGKLQTQWKVKLHLNDSPESTYSKDHLSIIIKNELASTITAEVAIYVVKCTEDKDLIRSFSKTFKNNDQTWNDYEFLEKKFLLDNRSEWLPNGDLTLLIEITTTDNVVLLSNKKFIRPLKNQLTEDMTELYNTKLNSDVTIIVEDKRFQVHKAILSARSPVLAAMFSHNMLERETNEVSIIDVLPDTFEKLLDYVYTDKVSNLDEVAAELLEAANKYQIMSLVKICEDSLIDSLNRDNIFKRIVLADRYNAKNLMDHAIECIKSDLSYILGTNDFKEFEQNNQSLSLELFKKISVLTCSNTTNTDYEC